VERRDPLCVIVFACRSPGAVVAHRIRARGLRLDRDRHLTHSAYLGGIAWILLCTRAGRGCLVGQSALLVEGRLAGGVLGGGVGFGGVGERLGDAPRPLLQAGGLQPPRPTSSGDYPSLISASLSAASPSSPSEMESRENSGLEPMDVRLVTRPLVLPASPAARSSLRPCHHRFRRAALSHSAIPRDDDPAVIRSNTGAAPGRLRYCRRFLAARFSACGSSRRLAQGAMSHSRKGWRARPIRWAIRWVRPLIPLIPGTLSSILPFPDRSAKAGFSKAWGRGFSRWQLTLAISLSCSLSTAYGQSNHTTPGLCRHGGDRSRAWHRISLLSSTSACILGARCSVPW